MAEGDATVYQWAKLLTMQKQIDFDSTFTDTFKIILLDSNYSLDADCTPAYSNLAAYELDNSDSGYTTGGITMTGYTLTQEDSSDNIRFDADDVTWSSLETNIIKHAVIWCNSASDEPAVVHFEIATNSNGGDYTLQFGASGIILLA